MPVDCLNLIFMKNFLNQKPQLNTPKIYNLNKLSFCEMLAGIPMSNKHINYYLLCSEILF